MEKKLWNMKITFIVIETGALGTLSQDFKGNGVLGNMGTS